MKILQEFKDFAMKGNVVDMAVGVIIGGAFGKIITSLVNDILMPPIGLLMGGTDFSKLSYILQEATVDANGKEIAAVSINYGAFIQVVINFLIIALCIFFVVRSINNMKKKEEATPTAPPAPSKEEVLLSEIRDILKNK